MKLSGSKGLDTTSSKHIIIFSEWIAPWISSHWYSSWRIFTLIFFSRNAPDHEPFSNTSMPLFSKQNEVGARLDFILVVSVLFRLYCSSMIDICHDEPLRSHQAVLSEHLPHWNHLSLTSNVGISIEELPMLPVENKRAFSIGWLLCAMIQWVLLKENDL